MESPWNPNHSTLMHDQPHPESQPAAAYETRDVNFRAVLGLAAGIVLGGAIVCGGLWLLLASLRAEARRKEPVVSPLAKTQPAPPAPRLQDAPALDYRAFREQEDERLRSYGWIDREQKIARMPIERAIDLLAERGEPKIEPPQQAPPAGEAVAEPAAKRGK